MKPLICAFCGHWNAPETLYEEIRRCAGELITRHRVSVFYCGGSGAFDRMAALAVHSLKNSIPGFAVIGFWPIFRPERMGKRPQSMTAASSPMAWKRYRPGWPFSAGTGGLSGRRII